MHMTSRDLRPILYLSSKLNLNIHLRSILFFMHMAPGTEHAKMRTTRKTQNKVTGRR